jgi:glycosyltransferase involved in cell wall biosynthesis
MKILQITPYFLPHKGGTERYVYNLSKSLVDMGHNVTIYTSNIPETKPTENIDGISIFRFKSIAEPLRNPLVPRLLYPLKDLQKFDLIHVHRIYSLIALPVLMQKKWYDVVPVVVTHHGRARFEQKFKDFLVHSYEKFFFKKILSSCDKCIALSESDARFLASFTTENRIRIIPNAINSADLPHNSKQDIDQFLKIHNLEDKKIILYVGRLMALKGINYLIEAFYNVKNEMKDPSVVMVIAGDGDEFNNLKKITNEYNLIDSIRFIKDLSDTERNYLYQSSLLFALPSLSEGFPTTVLEAMFYGIPVIGTDIPVMKQNFSDSALLVPQRNSRALADAILSLLSDPGYALELSLKGKDKVTNNFTWDSIVKKYLDIYSQVISMKPP